MAERKQLVAGGKSIRELGDVLLATARSEGFAITEGVELDRASFISLVQGAGTTAAHRFGTGSAELLDLDASRDPKKIVTGRSFLPLHTDGAFVKTYPSFIILYCAAFDQPVGSGETQICHQQSALHNMPEEYSQLFKCDWEYQIHDISHFPTLSADWIRINPLISGSNGKSSMNVALPFPPNSATCGWSVRLPEINPLESDRLLHGLDHYLRSSDAYYSHRWKVGDLLMIDNTQMLHGRSAITGDGARHLYRGQLQ